MIENGYLVHGAQETALLSWRPSNPALYGLLTAFLTTLLSYQAAAIILDLCMGVKRSGRSRVFDIATMLLVRSFSPIAFLYSLFPNLRDLRSGGKDGKSENVPRSSKFLRFLVVSRLVFLLTIIPVINIATIVFNLESMMWLTAEDAKFGGLALGVNPNLSTQPSVRLSNDCTRAIFQKGEGEDAMATFVSCESDHVIEETRRGMWSISVIERGGGVLGLMLHSPTHTLGLARRAFVVVQGLGLEDPKDKRNGRTTAYQLNPDLTNKSAEALVDYGFETVKKICQNGSDVDKLRIETLSYSYQLFRGRAAVSKLAACSDTDPDDPETGGVMKIAKELSQRIVFIESERFEISIPGDPAGRFVSGQGLLLIRRRRSYVSVPILGMLTVAVVVLRVLLGYLTSNDLERGIGLILRQSLGLRCCDSMLASPHVTANYENESEIIRRRFELCCDDRDMETGTQSYHS